MKFQPTHYNSLKECIKQVINKPELQRDDKNEVRYLWDLFWASKWTELHRDHYNEGDYYDSHIQTAIKTAVKELVS